MPLFEFSCACCEHQFEYLVRSADWKKEVYCPSCGQCKPDRLHKLPSRTGGIRMADSSGSSRLQSSVR